MQSTKHSVADINKQYDDINNNNNFQPLTINNHVSDNTAQNNTTSVTFNNNQIYAQNMSSIQMKSPSVENPSSPLISPHFFSKPSHANNHVSMLLFSNPLLRQTTTTVNTCTVNNKLPHNTNVALHRRETRRRILFHSEQPNVTVPGTTTTYLAANTLTLALASLQLTEPSTEQLVAHIPNLVFSNLHELCVESERKSRGILLFLDVSGFTALTETYSHHAHKGINQLTHTLNVYFDKLVLEILDSDGDIYKFAGDAILALWQTSIDDCAENEENILLMCEKALNCAINLQAKCGQYQTDVGVVLQVKVALAYGSLAMIFVGNDEFKHYIMTGEVVKQVNECEHECVPGDITIAKSMYEKLSRSTKLLDKYNLAPKGDKGSMSVKYDKLINTDTDLDAAVTDNEDDSEIIMNNGKISQRTSVDLTQDENTKQKSLNSLQSQSHATQKSNEINHNSNTTADDISETHDDYIQNQKFHFQHRRHSITESTANLGSLIKTFIIRCVLLKIEHNQSLDYLSELRRVTISFIHLDISDDNQTDLCSKVQSVFIKIYEST
ncbi:unnamed protein product, partial [Didymodactylos carnosus]